MRRQPWAIHAAIALSIGFAAPTRAETSCELSAAPSGKIVTVKGTIKSIDTDRAEQGYWIVIELKDRCGTMDVEVSTKRNPRCNQGAAVSVTGTRSSDRVIDAQRVVCTK
jgi:dynactin complex subunit